MEKPILSVIIISYNQEKFLEQAIKSVINQKTEYKYEILLADDCSPDNSKLILEKYHKKYPKIIRIIPRKHNLGGTANSFNACSKAKGKYITVLEGDEKGNFSIEFTLDKGDLKDIIPQNIYNTSDDAFSAMCDRVMKESYRARWEDNRCMHIMIGMVIDTLVDYLAANAKNPGGVEVELAGFFLASAAVEDGKVVISILPGDLLSAAYIDTVIKII
jgi:glycosyltransferase involved in cell wall biosynthesis